MRVARTVSAVLGTLEVLALAFLNPLAGLFLAIYTWQIKYTSQIMLEPLPSLMSALAVLFYFKARSRILARKPAVLLGWLILSAIAPGPDRGVEVHLLRGGRSRLLVDLAVRTFRAGKACRIPEQRHRLAKSAVR